MSIFPHASAHLQASRPSFSLLALLTATIVAPACSEGPLDDGQNNLGNGAVIPQDDDDDDEAADGGDDHNSDDDDDKDGESDDDDEEEEDDKDSDDDDDDDDDKDSDDDDDDDNDDGDDGDDDEDEDDDDGDDGIKFDIGEPPDGEVPEGDGEFRGFIWIANSTQGTVSKVNTRTLVEEGRYVTRPDKNGDPSRTSVGIGGNVAVANRSGGITKIYADPTHCEDKNGNGTIDTATDKNFLAWNEEECVAWYADFPEYGSQRAVAWTAEQVDADASYRENVWVTGIRSNGNEIDVLLLSGETGEVLEKISIPPQFLGGIGGPGGGGGLFGVFPYGAYGGAVDGNNDFWFTNLFSGWLVRVTRDDMSVKVWEKPHATYGITVDPNGNVWGCGSVVVRFTPSTETWDQVAIPNEYNANMGGCMVDAENRLWFDVSKGGNVDQYVMLGVDTTSLAVVDQFDLPSHTHGVSIDFDGNVWGVSFQGDTRAYRLDPETKDMEIFDGLVDPYTYSDMTGFQLASVTEPPQG
ncbi:MAG: hypothetical protein V3V08_14485 [Nannocystaceae bacterium]